MDTKSRLKLIMRTSVVGISVNAFLALFKVIIGTVSNSIAIVLDGINNLSDAGSSLITIIGTALAGKPADKKHPFGYGRIEYLTALIISGLVLYAGVTSLTESVTAIINPEIPDYSTVTLIIVGVAIVVKLGLALFTQKMGRKANSDSLVASGKEAILDVMVSTATLIAAIIYIVWGVAIEAYIGALISLIIIKSGIELLGETLSKIIGEPAEIQLVIDLKKTIAGFEGVRGVYDLVMNNYGPELYMASVHIEIPDTYSASMIDDLTRKITSEVLNKHGVVLTAIGLYSANTADEELKNLQKDIADKALSHEYINAIHGFYANREDKRIHFDLVVSLDAKDRREVYEQTLEDIKKAYPDYTFIAAMDMDFNELKA